MGRDRTVQVRGGGKAGQGWVELEQGQGRVGQDWTGVGEGQSMAVQGQMLERGQGNCRVG